MFEVKEGMTFLLCENRILFDDNPMGRAFFSKWLENEHKTQEAWGNLIKQANETHNITVSDKEDWHDKKILKQLKVGKEIEQ